jgi:hypothetical protein
MGENHLLTAESASPPFGELLKAIYEEEKTDETKGLVAPKFDA